MPIKPNESSLTDLSITHSVEQAADHCRQAMQSYVGRRTDVVDHLQQAIAADSNCALAPVLLGLMLHGARHKGMRNKIGKLFDSARQVADGVSLTARENHYLQALDAGQQGDLSGMVNHLESIVKQHPDDVFALNLLQSELFWMGELPRSLEVSNAVNEHWHEGVPGYAGFLSCRAFDLEEAGQYDAAERCGRMAVEIDPSAIWATHAVAHVLYMQGRFQDGKSWIEPQQQHWDDCNQIKFHVWWHQCLFRLDLGEQDGILEDYDRHVRNLEHPLIQSMPDLYIDIQNGASMLWRLEHAGVDVGDRWHEMAELARNRLDDFNSPFTTPHFAVILAASGDYASCEKLITNIEDYVAAPENQTQTLHNRFKDIVLPTVKGVVAHRQADYKAAAAWLGGVRQKFELLGGSHAQQDLLFQILFDATVKADGQNDASRLLHEIEHIGFFKPATRVGYNLQSH